MCALSWGLNAPASPDEDFPVGGDQGDPAKALPEVRQDSGLSTQQQGMRHRPGLERRGRRDAKVLRLSGLPWPLPDMLSASREAEGAENSQDAAPNVVYRPVSPGPAVPTPTEREAWMIP